MTFMVDWYLKTYISLSLVLLCSDPISEFNSMTVKCEYECANVHLNTIITLEQKMLTLPRTWNEGVQPLEQRPSDSYL